MSGARWTKAKGPWVGKDDTGGLTWPGGVDVSSLYTVQTTDDTETVLGSLTLDDDTLYKIVFHVLGIETDSGEHFAGEGEQAAYRKDAGGAVLLGDFNILENVGSNIALAMDADANANTVRIKVTGLAATTIDWAGYAMSFKYAEQ